MKTKTLPIPNNTPVSSRRIRKSVTTEYTPSQFKRFSLKKTRNVFNLKDQLENKKRITDAQNFLLDKKSIHFENLSVSQEKISSLFTEANSDAPKLEFKNQVHHYKRLSPKSRSKFEELKDFCKKNLARLLERSCHRIQIETQLKKKFRSDSKINAKKLLNQLKVELTITAKRSQRCKQQSAHARSESRRKRNRSRPKKVKFGNQQLKKIPWTRTRPDKENGPLKNRSIYRREKHFTEVMGWADQRTEMLRLITNLEKKYINTLEFVKKMLMKIKDKSQQANFAQSIFKITRMRPASRMRRKHTQNERVQIQHRLKYYSNERSRIGTVGDLLAKLNQEKYEKKQNVFMREKRKFEAEEKILEKKIFLLKQVLGKIRKANQEEINRRIAELKRNQAKKRQMEQVSNQILQSILFERTGRSHRQRWNRNRMQEATLVSKSGWAPSPKKSVWHQISKSNPRSKLKSNIKRKKRSRPR